MDRERLRCGRGGASELSAVLDALLESWSSSSSHDELLESWSNSSSHDELLESWSNSSSHDELLESWSGRRASRGEQLNLRGACDGATVRDGACRCVTARLRRAEPSSGSRLPRRPVARRRAKCRLCRRLRESRRRRRRGRRREAPSDAGRVAGADGERLGDLVAWRAHHLEPRRPGSGLPRGRRGVRRDARRGEGQARA